jgi:hypothetical protein
MRGGNQNFTISRREGAVCIGLRDGSVAMLRIEAGRFAVEWVSVSVPMLKSQNDGMLGSSDIGSRVLTYRGFGGDDASIAILGVYRSSDQADDDLSAIKRALCGGRRAPSGRWIASVVTAGFCAVAAWGIAQGISHRKSEAREFEMPRRLETYPAVPQQIPEALPSPDAPAQRPIMGQPMSLDAFVRETGEPRE